MQQRQLLHLPAGSGWPSLYLAKVTRCSAVLIDLPFEGLCVASERARSDELSERCLIVQADGASLPLRGESFDGISHSDVLCCLQDKPGVLRECRRTIRGNGRMAFTVIFIRANLSATDFADAVAAGPPFVETEMDYDAMLAHTGWRLVSRADLTPMFVTSMRGLADARAGHADQLTDLVGATEYENMVARMREKLPAIERRLLERAMFLAQPV